MTLTQAVVLGLIQGLTEFLPISSSGHLILVPRLLGWPDQGLAFDAVIHLGTLLALIAYFRVELQEIALGLIYSGKGRRLLVVLFVGTIPAGLFGAVAGHFIESHLRSQIVVAASLIGWALVMWVVDRSATQRERNVITLEQAGWKRGLFIGFAQAIALIPGTSRSGVTITAGQLSRMNRVTAARFSFLLGIPITAAAGAVKTLEVFNQGLPVNDFAPYLAGLVAAALSGLFAVWFLVRYLERGSLTPFVIYRLILGGVILALI